MYVKKIKLEEMLQNAEVIWLLPGALRYVITAVNIITSAYDKRR